MPTIINPYSTNSGTANAIASAAEAIFGGDKITPAINREKLNTLQRGNVETENLMRAVATGQPVDWAQVAPALIGSGYKPGDFNDLNLGQTAQRFGAQDPRTQAAQVGAGQSYSTTFGASQMADSTDRRGQDIASGDNRYNVDRRTAESARQFNMTPQAALDVNGKPVFVPQSEATSGAFSPVLSNTDRQGTLLGNNFGNLDALSPEQQEALGARVDESKSGTPKNYVAPSGTSHITYDGVSDAQTGQLLPPGGYMASVTGGSEETGLTNSTTSGVQQNLIANKKFSSLLSQTRRLAELDPTNFGVPGFVKGTMADLSLMAEGIATGLGADSVNEAVAEVRRSAARNGVSPGLLSGVYDPNLTGLQTVSDLLVYSAAEALAGQSGRSVSDKDVQFFQKIVGAPDSWMMSQDKFLSKMDQLEQIVLESSGTLESALGGDLSTPPADPLAAARDAIKRGAPRDKVIERLIANGLDPAGL